MTRRDKTCWEGRYRVLSKDAVQERRWLASCKPRVPYVTLICVSVRHLSKISKSQLRSERFTLSTHTVRVLIQAISFTVPIDQASDITHTSSQNTLSFTFLSTRVSSVPLNSAMLTQCLQRRLPIFTTASSRCLHVNCTGEPTSPVSEK